MEWLDALDGPLPLATRTPAQRGGTWSYGAAVLPGQDGAHPSGHLPWMTAGMCWPGGTQG